MRVSLLILLAGCHAANTHDQADLAAPFNPAGDSDVPNDFDRPGDLDRPGDFDRPSDLDLPTDFDRPGDFAPAKAADLAPAGDVYWVSSTTGSDAHDGRAPDRAWLTMARTLKTKFSAGDLVHVFGTVDDVPIGDVGSGVTFVGDGPFAGRARIHSIALTKGEHDAFRNLEASGSGRTLVALRQGQGMTGTLRFIRFDNLFLHDGDYGVFVEGASDLTVAGTTIQATWMDGVLLSDSAGDRFSFIGGHIADTGRRGAQPHWALHGVYASGGHGHLFDGVGFGNNPAGASLSLRRGGATVRNCRFDGGAKMINYNNEDGAKTGLGILVYRNLFAGSGGSSALYIGGNNDTGVDDPGDFWAIFNNTFVDSDVNLGSGNAKFYDLYLRNNLFSGGSVGFGAAASGHVHVASNNGWWKTSAAQGSANLTSDPQLDAGQAVTAAAYVNAGAVSIAPRVTLLTAPSDPLVYLGAAPDIGREER